MQVGRSLVEARRRRLDGIEGYWRTSIRQRILDLGPTGTPGARGPSQAEYDQWRSFLVPRHDAFREGVVGTLRESMSYVQDPVMSEGLEVLRRIVRCPDVGGFTRWVILGEPGRLHGATHRSAQVDAMFARYRSSIDEETARLPNRVAEFVAGVGSAVDRGGNWLEAHPKSIELATRIGLLLIAALVPSVLYAIADVVRAFRVAP